MRPPIFGTLTSALQRLVSAGTGKLCRGCANRSTQTETIPGPISRWRHVSRIWAGWTRPGGKLKRASRSIRSSPSSVCASVSKAITPCIWRSASIWPKACVWPGCRRGDAGDRSRAVILAASKSRQLWLRGPRDQAFAHHSLIRLLVDARRRRRLAAEFAHALFRVGR